MRRQPDKEPDVQGVWDYAPALQSTSHVTISPRYDLFIGGRFVPPKSRKYFDTINPATEGTLAEVAEAGEADVDAAVRAAKRAYDLHWRRMPGKERGKYIFRLARMLQEKSREFAVLETLDGGLPIRESRDLDVPLAAAHLFYHAGWADKLDYVFPGRKARPLGVAAQVIPCSFPLLMAAWKLAPALAAGNTCVLKPAETTPLAALHLARLVREADLPPGVVNVLTGGGATGATLVAHKRVSRVAFTGSTGVGKRIQRALAGSGKRLTLELGGNGVGIVFSDAPIDQAIEGIVRGVYLDQGHVGCGGSRLLVEEPVHDLLAKKLARRIRTLRLGDPLDGNTDIGAIGSKARLAKIRELVDSGVRDGAILTQAACRIPPKGFWYPPSFFTNVARSMRIASEEIFGPVLAIQTFRTPDEAVEKANNTMGGLSAGVWTDKGSKVFEVSRRLRAGVVWANTYGRFDPASPFGGFKESGFGREGGRHGLCAYLEAV